jgi:hypothetical protein
MVYSHLFCRPNLRTKNYFYIFQRLQSKRGGLVHWLAPVIPATWGLEIGKIMVQNLHLNKQAGHGGKDL